MTATFRSRRRMCGARSDISSVRQTTAGYERVRVVVVGLGVQGNKRRAVAGDDVVATVDPFVGEADYRHLEDVPPARYHAVLLCTPDDPQLALLRYLLPNGKHARKSVVQGKSVHMRLVIGESPLLKKKKTKKKI